MSNLSVSKTILAEQTADVGAAGKNQGTLKAEGKDYTVFVFADSEAVTEAVAKFLQDVNQQPRSQEFLQQFEFIPPELITTETEIDQLLQMLAKMPSPQDAADQPQPLLKAPENQTKQPENQQPSRHTANGRDARPQTSTTAHASSKGEVYSSLFSLARTFNTTLSENRQKKEADQKTQSRGQEHDEGRSSLQLTNPTRAEQTQIQESRYDREGNGKQEQQQKERDNEKEGFGQNQQQQQKEQQKNQGKNKKVVSIGNVQASRKESKNPFSSPKASHQDDSKVSRANQTLGGIENIYIRFMALMARILGQAELEAHQLYLRIKDRTDAIDVLTLLMSKINAEKGAIDWTNNEEMKKLIEKARNLGVEIPAGKCKWSEDEKKLLKENIQMRKDSMEKMTQLERTDMQRYLQEASQCHQARSNVLKLVKEVMDTIIANMRP